MVSKTWLCGRLLVLVLSLRLIHLQLSGAFGEVEHVIINISIGLLLRIRLENGVTNNAPFIYLFSQMSVYFNPKGYQYFIPKVYHSNLI